MAFAICRIQKIKSWGQLKAHETHAVRERETPNANPAVENIQVVEISDNLDLVTLVKQKIGSQKIRSNAVLAVEILLSASAEYFRPQAPAEAGIYDKLRLDDFVDATVKWLHSSWGDTSGKLRSRIIRAELHLDEITPHIHAYLVPLDERGKLNCKALFGTRGKMYQLQDSFASAVAHLGIQRGIKGSTATYTKIKKYYAAVNQDSQVLDLEHCLPQPQLEETSKVYSQRVIEVLSPQLEIINYQLLERDRIRKQNSQLKQTGSRSEKLRQKLETELQLLRATNNQQDLPLSLVAYELGLNPDKECDDGVLDFVMRINECNFDDAVVWLCDRFGETAMLTVVTHHATKQALTIIQHTPQSRFIPPVSSQDHWQEVENYLTDGCHIPYKLVQTLYHRGLVYADITGNAVFLARSLDGEVTGAYINSINDTNNWTIYPQSKRSLGWFHLSMGGNHSEPTKTAILVSSPIEALSLIALYAPHKHRTLYLVVDSQHAQLPIEFLQTVSNLITYTSKDRFTAIKKLIPHIVKIDLNLSKKENLKIGYRE
jgi:Plasmid recombination enzyme